MTRTEIKRIVIDTIKQVKEDANDPICDLDSLRFDLGMDSLDRLDLIVLLENKLRIDASEEEIANMKSWTVSDLIGFVQRKRERVEKDGRLG